MPTDNKCNYIYYTDDSSDINTCIASNNEFSWESTYSDTYNLNDIVNRLEKLEKYFEKIKKIMPWVPDEEDEYK